MNKLLPALWLWIPALIATPLFGFTQPRAPLPLKAEMVTEELDGMDIPRIRLKGARDIQLDYIDTFSIAQPKNESMRLTHRFLKSHEFSLYVYPASSISGGVTSQSVNTYLRRKSEGAKSDNDLFEVITLPAPDDAPTKIRFLGAKPITIEYVILREIDGVDTRVMVQENWAELDGRVYLLRIEAPEDRFDGFFRMSKGLANSMFFVE